jgi:hypothetical protein
MSQKAFPFLKLSKDIRLVYEQLQPRNKYVCLSNNPKQDGNCAVIVVRSIEVGILTTCRLIHEEPHAVLLRTMKKALAK